MELTSGDFSLTEPTHGDLAELDRIYRESRDYFSFDPGHRGTEPAECLESGDLPPNGVRRNFHLLSCRLRGDPVGYVTFYEGYPDGETVYLCFLYLLESVRGGGYGGRAVDLLYSRFAERGFRRVRVAVSLKNWPGLRFWFKEGFRTLTAVSGDSVFSPEHYGCLELEKAIQPHC